MSNGPILAPWWHVYGAEIRNAKWGGLDDDGQPAPVWHTQTFGESTLPPDQIPKTLVLPQGELAYLASFDHEPTDVEMAEHEPEQYRDEAPADS